MARARNIKPSFFGNDTLTECSFCARLLFIGLWTLADRAGRLEDRPKRIKMALFPADAVDVDAELDALDRHGFIRRYAVDGRRIIQVVNFSKHQNPHVREPESDFPGPDKADSGPEPGRPGPCEKEHSASTVRAQCEHSSGPADSGFLIPDSGFLIPDSPSLIPDSSEPSAPCAPSRICDSPPEQACASPPALAEIPLLDGTSHRVTAQDAEIWAKAYPAVDIHAALHRMVAWIQANPANRKTRRGIGRFIVGWLARDQDRARPQARGSPTAKPHFNAQIALEESNRAIAAAWRPPEFTTTH